MITIRYNAFETNSSSSHALVISKQLKKPNYSPAANLINKEGYILVYGGEYELESNEYFDTMEKINVLAAAACSIDENDKYLNILKNAIKSAVRCKDVIFVWMVDKKQYSKYGINKNECCEYVIVDHLSVHLYLNILNKGTQYIQQFIFDNNCGFYTGSDNDHNIGEMRKSQRKEFEDKGCEFITNSCWY